MHLHNRINSSQERHIETKRVTVIGAIINLCLGIIKIVFGVMGHSAALVADGVHSLSDLLCDALVLVASSFSQHEADEEHPYGHRRFETAATFILGLVLIGTGMAIAYNAIHNIMLHNFLAPDKFTIIIALISIVANEWLFRYTLAVAKKINSKLLSANAWHSRADALSSIVVLIGLLGAVAGWYFLDDIAAVVVALFIAKIGFEWGWAAFSEITDRGLSAEDLQKIKTCILETDGIHRLHQLRTRTMADKVILDVHILVDPYVTASEGHHIAECARYRLAKNYPDITDMTIHVDVKEHKESLPDTLLPSRNEVITTLMPHWETLISQTDIHALHLYYFDNHIELTLELSASVTPDILQKLQESKQQLPAIKQIKLLSLLR